MNMMKRPLLAFWPIAGVLTLGACKPDTVELTVWDIVQENGEFTGLALSCAGTGEYDPPNYGELNPGFSLRTSPQICLSLYPTELGAGWGADTADEVVCIPEIDPCVGDDPLGDTCIHKRRATFSGKDQGPFAEITMVINASKDVSWGSTWTGRSTEITSRPLGPLIVGTYTLEDGGCTSFALTPY